METESFAGQIDVPPNSFVSGKKEALSPDNEAELPMGTARETNLQADNRIDRYQTAKSIWAAEIERMQQTGELQRLSEITTEEEFEEHSNALDRLYKEICVGMGLQWPPIA